jgi:two-component system chemotaxis response regulator CheB
MSRVVVIGVSFGAVNALKTILSALPVDFPAPILIVSHIGARNSVLPEVLSRYSTLPVSHAIDFASITAGEVLLAPPDMHLTIKTDGRAAHARLFHGPKENHARPAIDPLFRSAAAAYGAGAIGVVLTGYLDDGTAGLHAIKTCGGVAIVQDPDEADAADMPSSALTHVNVDLKLHLKDIGPALTELTSSKVRTPTSIEPAPGVEHTPGWVEIENRYVSVGGDIADLAKIGRPSTLTCPECNGSLWEIFEGTPQRYRCHTGHAFTAKVLEAMQCDVVEDALWAAIRALHEQEHLVRRLQEGAQQAGQFDAASEYLARAEQARRQSESLRNLIASVPQAGSSDTGGT